MRKYENIEVYGDTANVGCGDCKHWSSLMDAAIGRVKCSTCKRMDGRIIKFYKPCFATAPSTSNFICKDFEPVTNYKCLVKYWKGFDDYFSNYIKYWDPTLKRRMDSGVAYKAFTVQNDRRHKYRMKLQDFIDGNMWRADGKFNVYRVDYYKRGRLTYDLIDGLELVRSGDDEGN